MNKVQGYLEVLHVFMAVLKACKNGPIFIRFPVDFVGARASLYTLESVPSLKQNSQRKRADCHPWFSKVMID